MFGPLNGVRAGLVTTAVVAAAVSAFVGQWAAASILGAAIILHGARWWVLYQRRPRSITSHTEPSI